MLEIPYGLSHYVEAEVASPDHGSLSGHFLNHRVVFVEVAAEVVLSGESVLSLDGIEEGEKLLGFLAGVRIDRSISFVLRA